MSNNIDLLDRALAIVNILRGNDHECVIAGGAARDSAHGVKFRDIDVIVLSENSRLYELLDILGFKCHEDNEYQNGEDCGRIRSVWKYQKLEGIDVIVYNHDKFATLDECIEFGFDCNMSQYKMEYKFSWLVRALHAGDKTVKLLRDDVSTKRMERLIEIANNLGWDSTELQQRVTEAKEREGKIPTFE